MVFCLSKNLQLNRLYLFLWLFSYSDMRMRLMRKELLHRKLSLPFCFLSSRSLSNPFLSFIFHFPSFL